MLVDTTALNAPRMPPQCGLLTNIYTAFPVFNGFNINLQDNAIQIQLEQFQQQLKNAAQTQ
ncbi:MAG: hypothetical protein R3E08_02340 [Thiotrichaceae bacterium]